MRRLHPRRHSRSARGVPHPHRLRQERERRPAREGHQAPRRGAAERFGPRQETPGPDRRHPPARRPHQGLRPEVVQEHRGEEHLAQRGDGPQPSAGHGRQQAARIRRAGDARIDRQRPGPQPGDRAPGVAVRGQQRGRRRAPHADAAEGQRHQAAVRPLGHGARLEAPAGHQDPHPGAREGRRPLLSRQGDRHHPERPAGARSRWGPRRQAGPPPRRVDSRRTSAPPISASCNRACSPTAWRSRPRKRPFRTT